MLTDVFANFNSISLLCCVIVFALLVFLRIPARNRDLRQIPGPRTYAATRYRLAWDAWRARAIHSVHQLHRQYGRAVRIEPNVVSFNSLPALKTIYGAGSGFERTSFYSMFDVYGRPNLFTFASGKHHRDRKKLLSNIYANQTVLSHEHSKMVQGKVEEFLQMLEREPVAGAEIFSSLHYFSFDTISEFVYGPNYGGTKALSGSQYSRQLLDDILNPARRRLAWFATHFPSYTKWVTSRRGLSEKLVSNLGLLPCKKPFVYTGIREHALKAFYSFKAAPVETQLKLSETTVIGKLVKYQKEQGLSDMDIASECADHLLAGIDTTSDSLMFLIWAMSLPQNRQCQERLRRELSHVSVDERGIPYPKDLAQLPYLNAVLKESLRLYSPLPAFEPRTSPVDTVIDGYQIPAGTVVGMSPYCLHRQADVFPEPTVFRPERWMTNTGSLIAESDAKNKWFWAFSSGARMCIGMHLANSEMMTLTAAVFRMYTTSTRYPDTVPGITSRYEIFSDDTSPKMVEHECWIDFAKIREKE